MDSDADMQINDLAQRIDAASDKGDAVALESLDAECALNLFGKVQDEAENRAMPVLILVPLLLKEPIGKSSHVSWPRFGRSM